MHGFVVSHARRGLAVTLFSALALGLLPAAATPAASPQAVWTKQFGTAGYDQAQGIAARPNGIYVTGPTEGTMAGTSAGYEDVFVRKYGAGGGIAWTRQFGSDKIDRSFTASATAEDVYVGGQTSDSLPGRTSRGGVDGYVARYSSGGTLEWTRQLGTAGTDSVFGVAATTTGVFVGGSARGSMPDGGAHTDSDTFLQRYSRSGSLSWTRQYGSTGDDEAQDVAVTPSAVYVAGYTGGNLPGTTSKGGWDAFLVKYEHDGTRLWTRQFGTASFDAASGVAVTPAGIFVAGRTAGVMAGTANAGNFDGFVRRYDPAGNVDWTRQFGTEQNEYINGMDANAAGVYLAGFSAGSLTGNPTAGDNDMFARRYSPGGGHVWTSQFGDSGGDGGHAIGATTTGVYLAGGTDGAIGTPKGNIDAVLRRYVSYRPDAAIGGGSGAYEGNDIYNDTGNGQTQLADVPRGVNKAFRVRLESDGDASDVLKVDGCGSTSDFRVEYFSAATGGTEITDRVVAGTFARSAAPGAVSFIRAVFRAREDTPAGATRTCAITLSSTRRPALSDTVKARMAAPR